MIICFNKQIASAKNKKIVNFYISIHLAKNVIAKYKKIFIIQFAFGVSSNGRTRDFGSLYHGSNPCAPTK